MFEKSGVSPFVLLHEAYDKDVALKLQGQMERPVEIIEDENPLNLRRIIGNCQVVLSSRFHGLACALNQNIPCIATEWTPKFRNVMRTYNCEEFLVSPLDGKESVEKKIQYLCDPVSHERIVGNLREVNKTVQKEVDVMWNDIEILISKTVSAR
jgi:colanic acid/amylovoran biosynthesis protein